MLKNDKFDELEQMFLLYSRVPETLPFMTEELSPYVYELGKAIVTDVKNQTNYQTLILLVIEMREKMEFLIEKSFHKEAKFVRALDNSFSKFTDLHKKFPQFLAEYCHFYFSKDIRGKSDA